MICVFDIFWSQFAQTFKNGYYKICCKTKKFVEKLSILKNLAADEVVAVIVAVAVVVIVVVQWNPREVNSRLKSTLHGGPDFFLLCLSNFICLKVNGLGPILSKSQHHMAKGMR